MDKQVSPSHRFILMNKTSRWKNISTYMFLKLNQNKTTLVHVVFSSSRVTSSFFQKQVFRIIKRWHIILLLRYMDCIILLNIKVLLGKTENRNILLCLVHFSAQFLIFEIRWWVGCVCIVMCHPVDLSTSCSSLLSPKLSQANTGSSQANTRSLRQIRELCQRIRCQRSSICIV